MKQKEIERLVDRYLAGKATLKEREFLNQWNNSFDDEKVIVAASEKGEKEKTRERMLLEIKSRIASRNTGTYYASGRSSSRFTFMKIAASIAIIVSISYGIYWLEDKSESGVTPVALIEKSAKIGQKSKITLTDGTVVHLNSGSSLRFPERFDGDTREIALEGEAFFEVARDETRPFIVTSGALKTTVLGTSFNIRAYPEDEEVQVLVATGKVRVEASPAAGSQLLTPNQAATYNNTSKILDKTSLDAGNLVAWKDGWLIFESHEIGEVVTVLERWYGTKIIIVDEELKKRRVTLKQQDETLKAVLEVLSYLAGFQYEIENGQVTITKN